MRPEARAESGSPLRLVVVDDQPLVAEAILRTLRVAKLAAEVVAHPTAAGALEAIRAARPDLVLLDLVLGDGDGFVVLDTLVADPEVARVPVIVLSGNEDPHAKADAFARGAVDYIVKLPPAPELLARLRSHARAGRAARERDAAIAQLDDLNRLLAIANETLAGDAAASRARLDAAQQLGAELLQIQDLDLLLERVLAESHRCVRSRAAAVFVREGDSLRLEHASIRGHEDERTPHPSLPRHGDGLVAKAVDSDRPLVRIERTSDGPPLESSVLGALAPFVRECTAAIAMPLATATVSGGEGLGALLLVDDAERGGYTTDEIRQAQHLAGVATLALERARLIRAMILRMVAMAELRDPHETGAHVRRVAGFSVAIFDAWLARGGRTPPDAARLRDRLYIAALLHDVGKVGIPDAILKKPGRLDAEERAAMEQHTHIGAAIFGGWRTDFDEAARDVALGHHERWDGRGYPSGGDGHVGAHGEAIPLFARIVAIADVFDALSSKRSYKEPWPEEKVVALLKEEAGRQFDPALVAAAIDALPTLRRIQRRFRDSGTGSE
jgi:response regulator RpfG family c-di-GMP phosphodiesterase